MVSSDDAMRGAFLVYASESAQVEGRDDCHAREYAVIRSDDLDAAVVELIVDALALCVGSVWAPWCWVRTEAELWGGYVQACAAGSAVVFYQGDPQTRIAERVVSTPAAARLAARVGAPAVC
jgi:hypothetical protein